MGKPVQYLTKSLIANDDFTPVICETGRIHRCINPILIKY